MSWFWPGIAIRTGGGRKETHLHVLQSACSFLGESVTPLGMLWSQPAGTAFRQVLPAPTVRMSWAFFSRALSPPLFTGQGKHGTDPALLVLYCTKTPLWERTLFFLLGTILLCLKEALPKFFNFATEHFLNCWEKTHNSCFWRAGREERQGKVDPSCPCYDLEPRTSPSPQGWREQLGEDESKILSPAFSICYCGWSC